MPSEADQRTLQQPWKQWHSSLDPESRKDIQEGNVVLARDDSTHGTVATDQKDVDLSAKKEVPKTYVK